MEEIKKELELILLTKSLIELNNKLDEYYGKSNEEKKGNILQLLKLDIIPSRQTLIKADESTYLNQGFTHSFFVMAKEMAEQKTSMLLEWIKEKENKQSNNNLIDYSQSSVAKKLIALNEIGVLNFLKEKEPFNMSTNSLAEFLSLCLGEKARTIQSYINPLFSNADASKSPYNSTKTVKEVKQKLIEIGLKIK